MPHNPPPHRGPGPRSSVTGRKKLTPADFINLIGSFGGAPPRGGFATDADPRTGFTRAGPITFGPIGTGFVSTPLPNESRPVTRDEAAARSGGPNLSGRGLPRPGARGDIRGVTLSAAQRRRADIQAARRQQQSILRRQQFPQ